MTITSLCSSNSDGRVGLLDGDLNVFVIVEVHQQILPMTTLRQQLTFDIKYPDEDYFENGVFTLPPPKSTNEHSDLIIIIIMFTFPLSLVSPTSNEFDLFFF